MRIVVSIIVLVLTFSCVFRNDDFGATVGDCDDICTVYFIAQKEIKKTREVFDKDFPDKELRRDHVTDMDSGGRYHIDSWFQICEPDQDTIRVQFSCDVLLDLNSDNGYVVSDLVFE